MRNELNIVILQYLHQSHFLILNYVGQENLPLLLLLLRHHFVTTARQSLNAPSCMHTVKVSFPV